MTPNDVVTVKAIGRDDRETSMLRELLPNAEEQTELIAQRPEGSPEDYRLVDVWARVVRWRFASISSAFEALRSIKHHTSHHTYWTIETTTTLDQRQVFALAHFHVHQILALDRLWQREVHAHDYAEDQRPEYNPTSYDDLLWSFPYSGVKTSHFLEAQYHLRQLTALESILGRDHLREIYESMAAQRDREFQTDLNVGQTEMIS